MRTLSRRRPQTLAGLLLLPLVYHRRQAIALQRRCNMASTPKGMPWVKLYSRLLDDPHFGRLSDSLKWRWVSLELLAGDLDADGALLEDDNALDSDALAWRLRVPMEALADELQALEVAGLLARDGDAWLVVGFDERQGRAQSQKRELWRERKDRQRGNNVTRESRVNPAPRQQQKESERRTTTDKDENAGAIAGNDGSRPVVVGVDSSFPELRGLSLSLTDELIDELLDYPAERRQQVARYAMTQKKASNPAGLFLDLLRRKAVLPAPEDEQLVWAITMRHDGSTVEVPYLDHDALKARGWRKIVVEGEEIILDERGRRVERELSSKDDSGQDDLPEDVLQF